MSSKFPVLLPYEKTPLEEAWVKAAEEYGFRLESAAPYDLETFDGEPVIQRSAKLGINKKLMHTGYRRWVINPETNQIFGTHPDDANTPPNINVIGKLINNPERTQEDVWVQFSYEDLHTTSLLDMDFTPEGELKSILTDYAPINLVMDYLFGDVLREKGYDGDIGSKNTVCQYLAQNLSNVDLFTLVFDKFRTQKISVGRRTDPVLGRPGYIPAVSRMGSYNI